MANEFKIKNSLIINSSGSVNALDIQGSQGQLFSVTDSLSGSLFSVSDISGLPIIEVLSDDTVKMGTFANEALIVTGSRTGMGLSNPAAKLHVSGTANSILLEIDAVSAQNILFISGSGNVGIGTNTPAYKLDVIGNGRFRGSGTTSATTAFLVQNNTPTDILTVRDDGAVKFGAGSFGHPTQTRFQVNDLLGNGLIRLDSSRLYIPDSLQNLGINGLTILGNQQVFITCNRSTANGSGIIFNNNSTFQGHASLEQHHIDIAAPFSPTVNVGGFNSLRISTTINQTGGASGITKGLYIDPTLTSAFDWRSIEWNNNTGWGLYGRGTAPNFLSGSLTIANSLTVTGSVIISGSSTFTNIGPAIFSGSVDVAGSITATQFIGDGSQLTGVATPTPIRRHDYSGSYSYCGTAPSGSSEASSVWSIDRIQVLSDGNVNITSASLVTWTDRYTHIYV